MSVKAVGIDLGTTFSVIAYVNPHGVPEVLPNAEGDRLTPSVILFDKDEVVVGNYARQSVMVYPDQVVEFVKRHMGESDYFFEYRGERYSPERLSSFILARLKHDAELRLGEPVENAVITVPAYFGDKQRRSTMMAGEMAGLKVLKLVNEPTSAAFAYGLANIDQDRRVLVFDLGGGTFDVTIVDIVGHDLNVVATNGDHQLGGKEWDDALIEWVAHQFKQRYGIDPLDDATAYQDLRQKCVSAKISLSRRPRVNIFFDFMGHVLRAEVTREQFEELTAGLVKRCEMLTRDVLDDASIAPTQVDTVLLAGGSTRMPMVRRMVEDLFQRSPATDINPDECVGLGAALSAAIEAARLSGEAPPVDLRTHDVTSHSLGMVALRDGRLHNSHIILRNSRIPAERTRDDYVTTHEGQTTMDLWLVQGENPDPLECSVLGHFEFYGIPPRGAGQSRLGVTFRYNVNGIVEVEAMDLTSGQTLPHRLSTGTLTLEDLIHGRVPQHIVLLVDCSGSMYGPKIDSARRAAASFMERTLRPGRQIAVIGFPGGILAPLTADPKQLGQAVDNLTPIGSTPLAAALRAARNLVRPKAGVQRIFVVLTDGHPDEPDETVAEAERVKSSGGRLITVGVGREVRQDFLRSLASTGTDFHFVEDGVSLEDTFINLATELQAGGGPS